MKLYFNLFYVLGLYGMNLFSTFYQTIVSSHTLKIAEWTRKNYYQTDFRVILLQIGFSPNQISIQI